MTIVAVLRAVERSPQTSRLRQETEVLRKEWLTPRRTRLCSCSTFGGEQEPVLEAGGAGARRLVPFRLADVG